MQPLVTSARGSVPDNHVVSAVSRRNPGRTSTVLTLAPGKRDRGGICCGNFVDPDRARIVMKTKLRPLVGVISDSRGPSVST